MLVFLAEHMQYLQPFIPLFSWVYNVYITEDKSSVREAQRRGLKGVYDG